MNTLLLVSLVVGMLPLVGAAWATWRLGLEATEPVIKQMSQRQQSKLREEEIWNVKTVITRRKVNC